MGKVVEENLKHGLEPLGVTGVEDNCRRMLDLVWNSSGMRESRFGY